MTFASIRDAIAVIRETDWSARFDAELFLARQEPAALFGYLDDEDWKVRLYVARALAQTVMAPSPKVAEVLEARLSVEQDDWVERSIRWGVQVHRQMDHA